MKINRITFGGIDNIEVIYGWAELKGGAPKLVVEAERATAWVGPATILLWDTEKGYRPVYSFLNDLQNPWILPPHKEALKVVLDNYPQVMGDLKKAVDELQAPKTKSLTLELTDEERGTLLHIIADAKMDTTTTSWMAKVSALGRKIHAAYWRADK